MAPATQTQSGWLFYLGAVMRLVMIDNYDSLPITVAHPFL